MTSSPIHFKTPVFEGPLDLLLHLIRANRIEISDIPIAEITQQYLGYVRILQAIDLPQAGEYILMAATLIEIKSRMLLPKPQPPQTEEEDPRAALVARLKEYEQFRDSAETFRDWEDARRLIFFRSAAENLDDYILPVPKSELEPDILLSALNRVLSAAGLEETTPMMVVPRRRLSLRLKMIETLHRIQTAGGQGLLFENLFDLPCSRYELVLSFLALLELLRQEKVRFEQDMLFGEIRLWMLQEENVG